MPTKTASISGVVRLDNALTASGLGFHLESNYDLANIKTDLQHRHDKTLNRAARRRYKAMFKAGSTPNPIGVTRDHVIIWGNHRRFSAEDAGRTSLPAIIIDVDGIGASKALTDQLVSLAVEENADHGVAYTSLDRAERAVTLLDNGYTPKAIQALLGMNGGQVSKIKREQDAKLRLEALGMTVDAVPHNVLGAMGGPKAKALNDGPFQLLVGLVKDAKLAAAEINALAEGAKAAGSDSAATQYLNDYRTQQAQRIASVSVSGRATRPTPGTKLRDALSRVTGLCDAQLVPATYKDHNPATVADTVQQLTDSIACLQGILAVQ